MKSKLIMNSDVQLVAAMVAKILRDDHQLEEAPAPEDYNVVVDNVRINGSNDIRVAIKLDRGLAIDLKQHWWGDHDRDIATLVDAATAIAEEIAALRDMRQDIIAMTTEVRSAATREIAKARRRGLPYRLVSTTPCAIYVKPSEGVTVTVVVELLSESLKPERAMFDADGAADVVQVFADDREVQEKRLARRTALDAVGANGRIDSVVVNAMREAGHDVAEVLKLLATTDDRVVDVGDRAGDKKVFLLHWNSGDVHARLTLDDGTSWKEDTLYFKCTPIELDAAKGRRLRDVMDNPIFGYNIRIQSTFGKKGGYGSLWCAPDLLYFNADTGKLWAA